MTDEADEGVRELDVDHVAELANLPLDEQEREDLDQAASEVLEALHLPEIDEPRGDETDVAAFEDEPEPWPDAGIEAILAAFPERDGRQLSR